MLSGVLQKQLLRKTALHYIYPPPVSTIFLKDKQKRFSTAFNDLLARCFEEHLPVVVSET